MGKTIQCDIPEKKTRTSHHPVPSFGFSRRERLRVRTLKREIRNKLKIMKRKEYQKLRIMVPSIATKPHVSKVTVIEEAVRYIDELHTALLEKLQMKEELLQRHLDADSGMPQSKTREVVRQLMEETSNSLLRRIHEDAMNLGDGAHNHLERNRLLPSYHFQLNKKT